MSTVTVSPKFQIVNPKEIRQCAGIQPGQKLEVFRIGDVIELAPVKALKGMRGSLPGLDTEVDSDAAGPPQPGKEVAVNGVDARSHVPRNGYAAPFDLVTDIGYPFSVEGEGTLPFVFFSEWRFPVL